jgi:hypothetical protein
VAEALSCCCSCFPPSTILTTAVKNLIINEDFSHSGPLITMATPSAANGHIAKMLLKRRASHTAVVHTSFPYHLSIMTTRKQHILSTHLLCCAHLGPLLKYQENKRETINIKRERVFENLALNLGKDVNL